MNVWLQKITSRKFLVAAAGVAFGLTVVFGLETPESLQGQGSEILQAAVEIAKTVAGALTALASVWKYVDAEGKVDAARVANEKV